MSSRPSRSNSNPVSAEQSADAERHLPDLKRLVSGLQEYYQTLGHSQRQEEQLLNHPQMTAAIIGMVILAGRGLQPGLLKNGSLRLFESLRKRFFQDCPPAKLDSTTFANQCCTFLQMLEGLSQADCLALINCFERLLQRNKRLGAASFIDALVKDDLATGWAQEYLIGLKAREEHLSNDWPAQLAKTQFFTPAWISAHLCSEAMAGAYEFNAADSFKMLDPACGAGHLLVHALRQALTDTSAEERPAALVALLSETLYGLDVAPDLLSLASFNLYLSARENLRYIEEQSASFIDLPLPHLYCLPAPLGSLALSNKDSWQKVVSLGGSTYPLPAKFDAVVMNPPYLSTRTMDDTTANFLKEHFPESAGDLYTAFMQLGISLLKEGGRLATIVQQSFLSITRYRAFRLQLLHNHRLTSIVQLGTGAFPSRPGEKVNNSVITVYKIKAVDTDTIKFRRLKSRDYQQEKMPTGFSGASTDKELTYAEAQKLINSITGQPFAFQCPSSIASIFLQESSLGDLDKDFVLTNGLFTCDNKRFVKLEADLQNAKMTAEELKDFVPYDKGGGQKWYHRTNYLLLWGKDGQAIRDFRASRGQSRSLPGENFYFKEGITYSYIGTKGFRARLLSEGAVFDIASSALFSLTYDHYYLLGFLNSSLVAYLLSLLNPTINFQIGDLRRLPFKKPEAELEHTVAALARKAVAMTKLMVEKEGHREICPTEMDNYVKEESLLQAKLDSLIFDHYQISLQDREKVLQDEWVQNGNMSTGRRSKAAVPGTTI